MNVTRRDITTRMRSRQWFRTQSPLDILCDSVHANHYQDVLDLYLVVSRVYDWRWVDQSCNISTRQPLARILFHLARDLTAWPLLYLYHWQRVARLRASPPKKVTLNGGLSALFLRTDHWFGVQSGGSVGHLRGVIEGLRALNYRTHVVSTDHLVGIPEDSDFYLCRPTMHIGRNLPAMAELLYNDQVISFVNRHWTRWSPSFIYQRYSLANYSGVLLKADRHVPYVCEYNGSFPWIARQWEKRKLYYERLVTHIELVNLKAADVVVVNSDAVVDELARRRVDPEKVLVNPNGVDEVRYSPQVDGSEIRRRHGLENCTVIGFIGTFGPWHGAEVLTEAFGRLLHRFPAYREQVRLFLIGDGQRMPQVKALIEQFGLTTHCILTGLIPQEQGPAYLAACDALVSPHVPNPDGSRFFGSPTKLFEYMAMGKGIVASNLEQIGQILEHDRTAWLVQPGDVEDLVNGLKVLIDDESRRERLGRAARAEVVAHYTWHTHTRRIVDKLEELCR